MCWRHPIQLAFIHGDGDQHASDDIGTENRLYVFTNEQWFHRMVSWVALTFLSCTLAFKSRTIVIGSPRYVYWWHASTKQAAANTLLDHIPLYHTRSHSVHFPFAQELSILSRSSDKSYNDTAMITASSANSRPGIVSSPILIPLSPSKDQYWVDWGV